MFTVAGSQVVDGAEGNAGEVLIEAGSLDVLNGAQLSANTFGKGNAGSVTIKSDGAVVFDGGDKGFFTVASSQVGPGAEGNAGEVSIEAGSLDVLNGAQLSVSTFAKGNAGSVTIKSDGAVVFDGGENNFPTRAFSAVEPGAEGNAGSILIEASSLDVLNGAQLSANTFGKGNAGGVGIKSDGAVVFDSGENNSFTGVFSQVGPGAEGNASGILIEAGSLDVLNDTNLSASTFGKGNAGSVTIKSDGVVVFDGGDSGFGFSPGVFSEVESGAEGNAGGILIEAHSLEILNGTRVSASTFGKGNTGSVTVIVKDAAVFDGGENEIFTGLFSVVVPGAEGKASGVSINAISLAVVNNFFISASTFGKGNAGEILLNLNTLNIANGGEILSLTDSSGDGGTIMINASSGVNLGEGVQDSASIISVETRNSGKAGDIIINTPNFFLSETARITATATETATNIEGGGSVMISADQVDLAGVVGIFAETQGDAPAGQLLFKPYQNHPNLDIDLFAGSKISAATSGSGNGGNLVVTAPNNVDISGAGILSVETSSSGDAGTIAITSRNLDLRDGVTVSASTAGKGDGGFIKFTIAEDINIFDSFVEAITRPGSTGRGGNINIDPINTNLVNSRVAVDSQGKGVGGDILVASNFLGMNNSAIATETFSSDGGNIFLNIGDQLFLEKGSNVTATAGLAQQAGNGGNITIFAPSIAARANEDSNIFADAFSGAGGRIFVSADKLINIGFQPENIPVRNDITASSEIQSSRLVFSPNLISFFQEISSLGSSRITDVLFALLNISSGSVIIESEVEAENETPDPLIDPSEQIDRRCIGSAPGSTSQFRLVGRGGRSPQPTDILDVGESLEDIGPNYIEMTPENAAISLPKTSEIADSEITGIDGWHITEEGIIQLQKAIAKNTPQLHSHNFLDCTQP